MKKEKRKTNVYTLFRPISPLDLIVLLQQVVIWVQTQQQQLQQIQLIPVYKRTNNNASLLYTLSLSFFSHKKHNHTPQLLYLHHFFSSLFNKQMNKSFLFAIIQKRL